MRWLVSHEGLRRGVEVRNNGTSWSVAIEDGAAAAYDVRPAGPGRWLVIVDGVRYTVGASVEKGVVYLQESGWNFEMSVEDARRFGLVDGSGEDEGQVRSRMPGIVVRTLVTVGEAVKAGQPLIVVEAMKMENEFKAPMDGFISQILVEDGQTVESGAVMLVVEDTRHET